MPVELPDVTDAELAVLQTLWDHGPSTIRHPADILYPGGKAAQYGTVQKLLERLEAKRCVQGDCSRMNPHGDAPSRCRLSCFSAYLISFPVATKQIVRHFRRE